MLKFARDTRGPGLTWQPGPRARGDSLEGRSFLLSLPRTLLARFQQSKVRLLQYQHFQGEGEGLDRLSLSNPRRAPVVLPSLQVNLQNISENHEIFSPIFISRTCWTYLGCPPVTGSAPPHHLPSKMKRWNILPSQRDPEKIELSSSFSPIYCHSGKMSYIFLPSLITSKIWEKLTTKTCQVYCARPQ